MKIVLQTPRLLLREFSPADAELLFDLGNDPEVMRHITGGQPIAMRSIREDVLPRFMSWYGSEGFGYFAAIERTTGDFIGWFQFRPSADDPTCLEVGYRFKRAAWGHGYATEGTRALIDRAFHEQGVLQIMATTLVENVASRHVLEKAGLDVVSGAVI